MKAPISITSKDHYKLKDIKAGEWISYSGTLVTMRDSSQKKLIDEYKKNGKLSVNIKDKIILYAAPTMSKKVVIGPTTSKRMDAGLELLTSNGVLATIGKGNRSKGAIDIIKKNKTPYFILMSGVSAYLSKYFTKGKVVAFKELGPEAIYEFTASGLLLLTAIDSKGRSIFDQ